MQVEFPRQHLQKLLLKVHDPDVLVLHTPSNSTGHSLQHGGYVTNGSDMDTGVPEKEKVGDKVKFSLDLERPSGDRGVRHGCSTYGQ